MHVRDEQAQERRRGLGPRRKPSGRVDAVLKDDSTSQTMTTRSTIGMGIHTGVSAFHFATKDCRTSSSCLRSAVAGTSYK